MLKRSVPASPPRKSSVPVPEKQLAFDNVRRDTGEPSSSLVRCVIVLVRLIKMTVIDFEWYARTFEMSERQFVRDLQHLRAIGSEVGITISNRHNGCVRLVDFKGRNMLAEDAGLRDDALRAVARALGAPAAVELGAPEDAEDARDRFLIYGLPRLLPGTPVAGIFAELKAAHNAKARVTFRYSDRHDVDTTRTVEPYRVRAHSGRYFLIAYDLAPRKGWRYFALDRIGGKVARAGTFKPRALPPQYAAAAGDAVGMLQRGGSATEVTVRLSPAVAVSTTSRSWQQAQRVEKRRDGSADITFTVNDIEEVVRWALGLGSEARVIAPERAVAIARRCVRDLQAAYETQSRLEERSSA